nr:zinc finger, CCHC-type [Tanacetum cinerariifolium]
GDFSVASIRKSLDNRFLSVVASKTRWIHDVPIKVNILAWKVRMDSLPTRLNISKRGSSSDREAEVFQVSNDDTAVAQIRLEDKQPEEKTNTDCLVYTTMYKECGHQTFRSPSSAIGFKKPIDILRFLVGLLVLSNGCLNRLRSSAYSWDTTEQHSTHELFSYKEDSNEAAFVKVGLKDDMDARSDVYVLSNGCRKCSDDNDGYYWEYTPDEAKGNVLGMETVRDQSDNTLRVSQSRFYNEKLVQTLLEGHSILSFEGSLSGDCDVEKNNKCSFIYAVG